MRKTAETIKKRYGKDYYARIGKEGGKAKNPKKGFGSNPELASRVGKIGGSRKRHEEEI